MIEWVSERVSEWVSECVSEWVREWESEWVSEWVSEWFGEFMCVFGDWLKLLETKIKIYELFSKLPVKNNLKKNKIWIY